MYTIATPDVGGGAPEYRGLSTDDKPVVTRIGTKLVEIDSKKEWMWDGSAWVVTKNAEWRKAIANAPLTNNDFGDMLYDPYTTTVYMYTTEWTEQFKMEEE